eukprot:2646411-Prymnesium_polylepis.1
MVRPDCRLSGQWLQHRLDTSGAHAAKPSATGKGSEEVLACGCGADARLTRGPPRDRKIRASAVGLNSCRRSHSRRRLRRSRVTRPHRSQSHSHMSCLSTIPYRPRSTDHRADMKSGTPSTRTDASHKTSVRRCDFIVIFTISRSPPS